MKKGGPKYRDEILKVPGMMFVAGETSEPSVETTTAVENIVRDQTVQLLTVAGELAARRGQAKFTTNDILFQVRHDPGRLARLRNHMRWKHIRKNAKVRDDGVADGLDGDEVVDLIEDDDVRDDSEATGPADSELDASALQSKNANGEKTAVPEVPVTPLPWSLLSMFPHTCDIPALASLEDDSNGGYSEPGPHPGSTTNPWLLAYLVKNDERTRDMTADEYATWSECRSASFTFRKKKTFREWCGLGVIVDHRAKDDVMEMLGFLTSEWVQKLTEQALSVKEHETRPRKCQVAQRKAGIKRKFDDFGAFSMPDNGWNEEERDAREQGIPQSPIQLRHVQRAFEMLQTPPKKHTVMLNGTQLRDRQRLRIF